MVIKDEQGENFDSHEVSDLHRSLLHSLGVQLGKERKLHSGEDFNICNYVKGCVCVFVSPVWNKPLIFIGGYVFLALGRPTGGLSIDQGSLSPCKWKVIFLPGGLRRRWGHCPELLGTRLQAQPGRWPLPRCPSRSKWQCGPLNWKLLKGKKRVCFNSASCPQIGGSHQLLSIPCQTLPLSRQQDFFVVSSKELPSAETS